METKDKIIDLIRLRGPSLPTGIAKHVGADSLFVSAHLSELKEQGRIKISYVKIGGGSPLYYLPGQESQLQNFSDNLGEKAKKVYELLKEKKVLTDSALVPVFRAAIRTIKDFAFPFTVNFKGKKELFWKWYLLSNEEAGNIIRNILGIKKEKKREIVKEEIRQEKKIEEKKPEVQKKIEEVKEKKIEDKKIETTNFYGEINEYFIQNRIKVIEENIVRKNSEIDFIVEVPSAVGSLKYYVKAKTKKRINDGDLSSVFIQGQTKRLPVLFLAKGELTKKAKQMLESEFKGMRFNRI